MKALLDSAIRAAEEAGNAVMDLYETNDFETKSDGSPVTAADTRANEILLSRLRGTGIAILSEESHSVVLPYPERIWIIDPLDGTRDFLKKTGDFCVQIGLIEDGRPVLGVVFAPAVHKLYFAVKGEGAHMTDPAGTRRLKTGTRTGKGLRCVRSVHHFSREMQYVMDILGAVSLPHGSIGIKTGLVAEDEGDFFFSRGNLGEWDVCAPEIILTESGGMVTDVHGKALLYGNADHRIQHGMVFTNGACHEELLAVLNSSPIGD